MTTLSLTSDGLMRWPPRDWLESLCVEQADGTWLVQAPLSTGEDPLLYLLPDAAAKDRFLKQAPGLIWLRVALSHWIPPLSLFPPLWSVLFFPVAGDFLGLLVMLPAAAFGAAATGVHFLSQRRLFTGLADAAVTPPAGWKRPDMLVRRWEEWQGLYLSLGAPGQRVLGRGMAWITAGVIAAAGVTYLNLCQGIGVLDQVFLDWDPRDLPRVAARCGVFGGWGMPLLFAIALSSLAWHRRSERRRQAGAARPLPRDLRLAQVAEGS